MTTKEYVSCLRNANLRATKGRIALLSLLAKEPLPLSIERIKAKLGDVIDVVTLYRALEALERAGVVERCDLGHGHSQYELRIGRPHHHHAVCRDCGVIEDVEIPHVRSPEQEAQRRLKRFSAIYSYSLSFVGQCKSCA